MPGVGQDGSGETSSPDPRVMASAGMRLQASTPPAQAPDYGQALAQQHAAAVQAFRQRMQFYGQRAQQTAQMNPQAANRSYMVQAMEDAGQDTDGVQSLWAQQDQAAAGVGQ